MRTIADIKAALNKGEYDALLARLYCREINELDYYKNRITHIIDAYKREFLASDESELSIFSAPGRTELAGNHTDHQGGKVLAASIDLDAVACAAINNTSLVNIYSDGHGLITVDLASNEVPPLGSTEAIIYGICKTIADEYKIGGFNAYVSSDVPIGSGLSSSACFEVLIGIIINKFFCSSELSNIKLAQIGQLAENRYFGKPSGLLDQMACALGGLAVIDFKDEHPQFAQLDLNLSEYGYAMCIISTGADHSGLTEYYAAVPDEMKSVAHELEKNVLSEVEESVFYSSLPALRAKLGDRAIMRAMHYFAECHRVVLAFEALKRKDFDRYLKLVIESGHSSYELLQNISTYVDSKSQAVALALALAEKALDGRGAVRVHGGGFAGTIQAYVPIDMLPVFSETMNSVFGEGACREVFIRPYGGAVIE